MEYNGKGSLTELVDSALESANGSSPDPWFKFPYWKRQLEKPIQHADYPMRPFRAGTCPYPRRRFFSTRSTVRKATDCRFFKRTNGTRSTGKGAAWWRVTRCCSTNRRRVFTGREGKPRASLGHGESGRLGSLARRAKPAAKRSHRVGWRVVEFLSLLSSVMALLLKALSNSLRADWAHAGKSRSLEWLNAQVFSPVLSIADEATYRGAAYCFPLDGEGVAIQRNDSAVKHGVLQSLLFNTYWGAHHNRASTGSCLDRGQGLWPQIEARCFTVAPSSYTVDDLFSTMGEGLYWTQASHFQVSDLSTGTFTLSGSGWTVVNGKPGNWLYLTGSLYDLFKSVIAVGDDLDLFGRFASPTLLVEFAG